MSNSQRQVKRANHFVAAGYLAPFTDSGTRTGVLQAYRRSDPMHPLTMSAESVAWERDLYTQRDPEGALDDSLEELFATDIEAPFLAVRNRFLSDPAQWLNAPITSLSSQERHAVAIYLAIQHLRTPTERDAANWLSDLGAVKIVRDVMSAGGQGRPFFEGLFGRQLSEGEIAEATRLLISIASHTARERKHWLIVGMRLAPRLADLFTRLEWHLLIAPPHINLPTLRAIRCVGDLPPGCWCRQE